MTRPLKAIFLGAAILIGYNLFARKVAAGTLNFLPGQLKGLRFDGVTPVITVGVLVQNTSNQSFTINSLAGNVYATSSGNKYNIGNVASFVQTRIAPNSQQQIFVDMKLSLIGVVSDVLNAIENGWGQDILFSGFANVDTMQVAIDFTYKL